MELPLASALAGALLLLALAAFFVRRAAGGKSLLLAGKQAKGGLRVDATSGDGANAAAAAAAAASSRGGSSSKPQVTLLFGTQTGTAERFAKQLKAELLAISSGGSEAPQVDVDVVDCEEFDASKRLAAGSTGLVLFLVATYGDGEPTDNAADLYNWLLKAAGEAERAAGAASGDEEEKRKLLPLAEVSFGVFGLGNKQYEHFCAVGKRVHRAMTSLGATPVVRRGDGDDDDDIEGDFDGWKSELLAALAGSPLLGFKEEEAAAGVPSAPATPSAAAAASAPASIIPSASSVPCYAVAPSKAKKPAPRLGGGGAHAAAAGAGAAAGSGPHSPALARVVAVRELHSPLSERSCTHVELDIGGGGGASSSSAPSYEAGDHIGILPSIPAEVAAEVTRALGLDPKAMVEISLPSSSSSSSSASSSSDLSRAPCEASPCSVSDAIARFADVLGPVPKAGVAAFAAFAATAKDAAAELARLSELLAPTPAGMALYKQWHAHSRCVLELVREFPRTARSLPLGALLGGAVAPRLAVRFYSISSSPNCHPEDEGASSSSSSSRSSSSSPSSSSVPSHRRVSVTAALVRETTATGRSHEGPASGGLRACKVGDEVAFFLRKSTFRLPSDAARPIVMVGPGTGLAPFRGFLQERAAILRKSKSSDNSGGGAAASSSSSSSLGEAHLFFGCRSKDHDFIYREELERFERSGALTSLRVAFSREGPGKVYVQHLIAEKSAEVARLITEEKASVYICGDARAMARDVHSALRDALGGGSAGDAVLKEMAESGRLQKDVW